MKNLGVMFEARMSKNQHYNTGTHLRDLYKVAMLVFLTTEAGETMYSTLPGYINVILSSTTKKQLYRLWVVPYSAAYHITNTGK